MGLYKIKCSICRTEFDWFSGSKNQLCTMCRQTTYRINIPVGRMRDISELLKIVEHQTNMQTLWTTTREDGLETVEVAMLRAALRHLHAVIEENAIVAAESKSLYWELESEL